MQFKKFHWYIVPLVTLVVWWAMLIALMSCWSLQGRPIYSFMGANDHQDPVYISDIAATNLQPLFISCSGFQALFFVGTLVMEHYLRTFGKLQGYVSRKQPILALCSIVCAVIGQFGIFFVSIFNTKNFHTVHMSMLVIFIAFIFLACCFNFFNTFIFGWYPHRLLPDHERVVFGSYRWQNLYFVSLILKLVWLATAATFALLFAGYNTKGNDTIAAVFEWTLSFYYGVLLVMWSIDLFPSAIKHYKREHPEEFSQEGTPIYHEEKEDEGTILTLGAPTYRQAQQDQEVV